MPDRRAHHYDRVRLVATVIHVWGAPRCPIEPSAAAWVEQSLTWLADQFGADGMHGTVVLPTDSFFPGVYTGSEADVRRVLGIVAGYIGVATDRVDFEFVGADDEERERRLLANLPAVRHFDGAAGEYRRVDGRGIISIRAGQAADPMALVATIAHELGHERLLGEGRISRDRADQERLTDLATVYFGLGIFGANAAFQYRADAQRWQASRLGYLGEAVFGYALAVYAHRRGETNPPWARHLDTNPRAYLTRGLKYLRA